MKRFFLIPLMAFFSCVMAFATNVGTLQELKDALAVGGEITLTANISTGNAALDVNKSVAIEISSLLASSDFWARNAFSLIIFLTTSAASHLLLPKTEHIFHIFIIYAILDEKRSVVKNGL